MTDDHGGTAVYFFLPFVIAIIGALIHTRRQGTSGARTLELFFVWWTVANGISGILGGLAHIGPNADETAENIGFTQSMFQWEVGWNDIGMGVLMLGVAWRRDFGWMTAAVVMWSIGYLGDAIGHAMQWIAHDNTAPANVWALPTDVIGPVVGMALLAALWRAHQREGASTTAALA